MTPLLVPPPSWTFKPLPGGFAPLEEPVTIAIGPVRFPDGSEITSDDLGAAQVLVSRVAAPSAPFEVWDAAATRWRDALSADLSQLAGIPLIPPVSPGAPWLGVLAATGQKDVGGTPMIREAIGGFPQYRARAAFRARRADLHAFGLSGTSTAVQFGSKVALARFAAIASPDAEAPTRIQLVLRNASARPVALLEIDASGASALTLRSFDGGGNLEASVELRADGDIRLTPAAGGRVVIAGDLEVERITYLPAAGLPRKTLN